MCVRTINRVANVIGEKSRFLRSYCGFILKKGWKTGIRLSSFVLEIPFLCFNKRCRLPEKQLIASKLYPGDLIFYTDNLFPLWQLFMRIVGRSDFCHVALYEGKGQLIEATTFHPSGYGVARTGLDVFLNGFKTFCVIRPPYRYSGECSKVLSYAANQIGKPYDYEFKLEGTDAMYCTKLVADAIRQAGLRTPVSFFLNKTLYAPRDFFRMEGMVSVYCGKSEKGLRWANRIFFPLSVCGAVFMKSMNMCSLKECFLYSGGILLTGILLGWWQLIRNKSHRYISAPDGFKEDDALNNIGNDLPQLTTI